MNVGGTGGGQALSPNPRAEASVGNPHTVQRTTWDALRRLEGTKAIRRSIHRFLTALLLLFSTHVHKYLCIIQNYVLINDYVRNMLIPLNHCSLMSWSGNILPKGGCWVRFTILMDTWKNRPNRNLGWFAIRPVWDCSWVIKLKLLEIRSSTEVIGTNHTPHSYFQLCRRESWTLET